MRLAALSNDSSSDTPKKGRTMSKVRKAWNGGSKEAAMEEARLRKEQEVLAKQRFKAHKVMTPEEYAAMPLIGWHMACKDFDGFGAVGVCFITPDPS